jgi:hypothetical protein
MPWPSRQDALYSACEWLSLGFVISEVASKPAEYACRRRLLGRVWVSVVNVRGLRD